MATLNTLRTKGGVILAVVIGISLLAFLLGDIASSGGSLLNSSKMNVGEINGQSISYDTYSSRIDELTTAQQMMYGIETLNEQQQKAVRSTAWEQISRESSFDQSFADLGFIVSDTEAIDMTDGDFISPILYQLFADPQSGSFDVNQIRRFISSLDSDPTGQSRKLWSYIESEMLQERSMSKYLTLVSKAVIVNDVEVEDALANANSKFNISFVTKSLSSIPDSTISVTEADYKKFYDEHRKLFKQVDSREIEYVVFQSLPSDSDYAKAEKVIGEMAAEFRASEDVEQYVNLNSQSKFDNLYYNASELPQNMRDFAFTASSDELYGPVLEGDVYTMARVVDVRNLSDSVGLRQIIVAPNDTKLADSLLTVLKKGEADLSILALQYSLDKQTIGGVIGTISPNQLAGLDDVHKKVLDSKKGDFFIANSPYGIHIIENTYASTPVEKAKLAVVTYDVDPSDKTLHEIYTNATSFLNAAKGDGDFEKAVDAAGLTKRVARLRAGDDAVVGLDNSQEIVRWAFGAEKGAVSDVISVGEDNIIAFVANSAEHGYTPLADVKEQIYPTILNEKKVALASADLKGSSLSDVANSIGAEVSDATDLSFGSFFVPNLGVAQEVIGLASALPVNTVSKPVLASGQVVVLEVTSRENVEETDLKTQKVVSQSSAETEVAARVYSAVYSLADIKDGRVKFF